MQLGRRKGRGCSRGVHIMFSTFHIFPWVCERASFLSDCPVTFLAVPRLVPVPTPIQSLSWILQGLYSSPIWSFPRLVPNPLLWSPFWLLLPFIWQRNASYFIWWLYIKLSSMPSPPGTMFFSLWLKDAGYSIAGVSNSFSPRATSASQLPSKGRM